jgi:hypothetical protein
VVAAISRSQVQGGVVVGGSPQFETLVYRGSDLASLGAPEIYFGFRTEANQHIKRLAIQM